MKLSKLLKGLKRAAPIIIANAPTIIAVGKAALKATKKPKPVEKVD